MSNQDSNQDQWKAAREWRKANELAMSKVDDIARALAEFGCPPPDCIGIGHIAWLHPHHPESRHRRQAASFGIAHPGAQHSVASIQINYDRRTFSSYLRRVDANEFERVRPEDFDHEDPAVVEKFAKDLHACMEVYASQPKPEAPPAPTEAPPSPMESF